MTAETPEWEKWSEEEVVTEEVEKLCIEMKADIQKVVPNQSDFFAPLTYRRLGRMGATLTLVKVYVGVDKCIHVILSQIIIPGMLKHVSGFEFPKTASAPLVPFAFKH